MKTPQLIQHEDKSYSLIGLSEDNVAEISAAIVIQQARGDKTRVMLMTILLSTAKEPWQIKNIKDASIEAGFAPGSIDIALLVLAPIKKSDPSSDASAKPDETTGHLSQEERKSPLSS